MDQPRSETVFNNLLSWHACQLSWQACQVDKHDMPVPIQLHYEVEFVSHSPLANSMRIF